MGCSVPAALRYYGARLLNCHQRLTRLAKTPSSPNLRRLKDLTRLMPDSGNLTKAAAALFSAPDNSSALIAVAWIDYAMKGIIKMRFRGDLSISEQAIIFENNGPASNLWSKVHLAYSLGIIGIDTKTNILALSEIRNVFAHATDFVSFKTPEIALACQRLVIYENMLKAIISSSKLKAKYNARDQFMFCSLCVFYGLSFGVVKEGVDMVRLRPAKPEIAAALQKFDETLDKLGISQLLP